MRKVHDLSQKQIQQLLETPGCTKDDELSERYSGLLDVYRLANGGALLHIPGTRRGVLYESIEDLLEIQSKHRAKNQLSNRKPGRIKSKYSLATYTRREEVPIEQCRGMEFIDLNDDLLLVQAPIEQVGQACCQILPVNRWERDVYGRKVEIIDQRCFLFFQFKGHTWTLIQSNSFLPRGFLFQDNHAQSLSISLHAKAISYQISDTGGFIGYHLYNCGESMERFYYEYSEQEIDEDRAIPGIYQFQSRLRQLTAKEIINPSRFTDAFLYEQNAYVPSFSWDTGFKVGQKVILQVQDLERDDFERMDYMVQQ